MFTGSIPLSGEVDLVCVDFDKPNGLAFSPDEKYLYIADTGITHKRNGNKHIRRFDVKDDGQALGKSKVFADCTAGLFDGFRVDRDGRIWTSAGDGVHCYLPDGTLIGKILIPELVANVCFGGAKLNRLFICGTAPRSTRHISASTAFRPARIVLIDAYQELTKFQPRSPYGPWQELPLKMWPLKLVLALQPLTGC